MIRWPAQATPVRPEAYADCASKIMRLFAKASVELARRLLAVGEAIGRSMTAGHWPGQGPADERLTQIADNLSRARNLVDGSGRPQQSTTLTMRVGSQDAHRQVVHMLYVAAHGTTVALSGYVMDMQSRLEVGARRRQPLAERPTALEITEAQGMIARFDGFEQLATAYLAGQPASAANRAEVSAAAPAKRLETALEGLAGSGASHFGRQPGSGGSGSDRPGAGPHLQHHRHRHRSCRQEGGYRSRHR